MPNSYVNDDGKPNLNNSNADNHNVARVAVRIGYTTLLRQPPTCLRTSVNLAWIFSIFVSLASFNSRTALSFSAVNSAFASAFIKYVAFKAFGACLAKISCSNVSPHACITGSLALNRYFLSIVLFSSISFLYIS